MKSLSYYLSFLFFILIACGKKSEPPAPLEKPTAVKDSIPTLRLCTERFPPAVQPLTERVYAGILSANRWRFTTGAARQITVSFSDGLIPIQNKIKAIASEWEAITSAKFVYVPYTEHSDIKISFKEKGASWSYIGTDSKNYDPSMNFGWLEEETVDSLFRSVVLHEFGHAIGLVHEHSLRNGNPIKWNVDSVYAYYMNYPNYWKVEEIEENIFKKYSQDQLIGGTFDPLSIMVYHIPASLTTDGYSTPLNVKISREDKKIVANAYLR